jgi:parallel beta helix pectate lyase-like protein
MKICSRLTFIAFLISLGCGKDGGERRPAVARTYYISSTSGNDNNDGQSSNRAWRHLSKIFVISNSTDTFRPGDRILLKRGDQWDGQIRLRANGTARNPVTIDAYGQGAKPMLYGDNPELRWHPVAGALGVYAADMGSGSVLGSIFLTGKNVKAIYPGGSLNRTDYLEAFLAELQSGTLAGQYDGRLWVRTSDSKPPQETVRVFRSAGVMLADSSYVEIENLGIQRFYAGIDVTQSHNILIHHNDIQDVLGIGIYLRSADVDCRVESNTVYRSGNTALYVLKGAGNIFRDNWVSHVDAKILGIQVGGDKMGVGLQESQRTVVENNYFTQSGGMDFFHEQNSVVRYNYLYRVRSAGSPNGRNLSVYGNIYNLGGPAGKHGATGVNVGVTGPGTIAVFNNTIVNANKYFLMGSSDNAGKIVFSDNLLSSELGGTSMVVFGLNVTSRHNCFFTSGEPAFEHSKAKFSNLKSYQEESGLDWDSIFADPQFLATIPVAPLDFRVGAASGCNSPVSFVPLPNEPNARNYDHDRDFAGGSIIGALRLGSKASRTPPIIRTCNSHCFEHLFAVPTGVYLVTLKFAPTPPSHETRFRFALSGREVVADFDSSATGDPGGSLLRYFIVRPDGHSIVLEPDENTDISIVTEVDIQPFDTAHGHGLQVIVW